MSKSILFNSIKMNRNKLKSAFLYLLISLPCISFAQQATCLIKGTIVDPKNEVQGIWLSHDGKQEELPIQNGEWVYSGVLVQPKIYGLIIKYKGGGHGEYFYLTSGAIQFEISTVDSTLKFKVIGPQISKDYQEKLLEPVTYYQGQETKIKRLFLEAKKQNQPDTLQLKADEQEAVNKCFNVPQLYIKANPGSPLCIPALNMLGNGKKGTPVTIDDLNRLFNSLSDSIKTSPEGLQYAEKLEKLKTTNQ